MQRGILAQDPRAKGSVNMIKETWVEALQGCAENISYTSFFVGPCPEALSGWLLTWKLDWPWHNPFLHAVAAAC